MPIYEYECKNCHHQFDLMQKINDPPAKQCPQCFETTVIRLVSPAGFQLKGTGWYATDFKNQEKPVKKEETKKVDNATTEKKMSSETSTNKKGDKD